MIKLPKTNNDNLGPKRIKTGTTEPKLKMHIVDAREGEEVVKLSSEQHNKLLQHCHNLLDSASDARGDRITEMYGIEVDLLGVAEPQGTDCDRAQQRAEGQGVAHPDRILPFGFVALRKYAAEVTAVVMPYEAPYNVVVSADKQDKATMITKAMRYDAARFDHRNNIAACVFDGLALDIFAARVSWASEGYSYQFREEKNDSVLAKNMGNKIEHLDPYNISFDASVEPHEVAEHGEFFAEFDMTSKFHIQRMVNEGHIFETDTLLQNLMPISGDTYASDSSYGYYFSSKINKGRLAAAEIDRKSGKNGITTDHSGLFGRPGMRRHVNDDYAPNGFHITKMQVRIDPYKFGLKRKSLASPKNSAVIYDIVIVNNDYVVRAVPREKATARFDVVVGSVSYDRTRGRHVSMGDAAASLSAHMSDVFNTNRRSRRKTLEGGVTIFNPEIIPLHELDSMNGGRLPTRQSRYDAGLQQHVLQLNDTPDTKNDFNDIEQIGGMLRNLLPSGSNPELAGLDRATQFQAQAVAMTADRDLLQDAAIFDGQLLTPVRMNMQLNIIEQGGSLTYIDEAKQQYFELTADELEACKFMLAQPSILMGIDRLVITNQLQNFSNMLLQVGDQISPVAMVIMEHMLQIAAPTLDIDDYNKAVAETQERNSERIAREQGPAQS